MNHIKKVLGFIAVLSLVVFAAPAKADQDPAGCTANGINISITTFRADGTTPVGTGTVQSGETIKFQTTLAYAGFPNCNFSGGSVTITTPDTVVHPVGNPGLVSSGNPFLSTLATYVVSEDEVVSGFLNASTSYTGGIAHRGEGNHPSVSGTTGDGVPYQDVSLVVTKTATPVSEIEYEWTIDKSVTPATWDLFNGDSGTSEYTIALNKTAGATSYSVSGTITIHNPALFATAVVSSVSDVLSLDGSATVVCPGNAPYNIPAGGDLICTYSKTLPGSDAQTNTATAETTGDVGGDSGEASVDFSNVIPTVTNNSVSVDDTFPSGDAGPFSDDTSYTYTRTFVCGNGQGEYEGTNNIVDNTATIVNTEISDSAQVTVNCYDLEVTKTANTTFDRTYLWNVEKSVDETELTLADGEVFNVNYTITATKTSQTDSNWAVSGDITIDNNHPTKAADITGVVDSLSVDGAVVVDCGGATSVPANSSIVCTYSSTLGNGSAQTNTATATQQNYDYDKNGVPSAGGTTNYSGNANVTFSAPANVIDEEVEVSDPMGGGVLGTVTVGESPKVFNYDKDIMFTGEGACGDHTVNNTATLTTNDTTTIDTASANVLVHINCFQGCTLTQGYWKTHNDSFKGGAPTDLNWNNITTMAEKTGFFTMANSFPVAGPNTEPFTWFTVFQTPPKGNAYYNLAHQWMAAKLNVLNGASTTPAVDGALASAQAFFTTYTPDTFNALGKKHQARKDAITWAGILGSYNEGKTGPGHCDEQNPI